MTDPSGHYATAGMGFSVFRHADGWRVEFAGVAGLGGRLQQTDGEWWMDGGPADGAFVDFTATGGHIGGVIPFRRVEEEPAPEPGAGLRPPDLPADEDRDRRFERVWASASGAIDWDQAEPKHTFVQWLMARDEVVFHGSNRSGIEEFATRRESVEVDDVAGRGNLEAVYATPDGLWAMYFAIVDRSRIVGSLRNGVADYLDDSGLRHRRYHFSLATVDLARRAFTTGTLYMFDRSGFSPIPLYPGGPGSMEWASPRPARPIASLLVAADDHPMLGAIGGHDEADRIAYSEVAVEVMAMAEAVLGVEPVVTVRLSAEPAPETAARYVRLGRLAWEGTDRRFDGARLTISGPDVYRKAVAATFQRAIARRGPPP